MSTPYIGSKISLISRLDIRYEGKLHSVDPIESTISLSQVRSFGTEDRPAPVPVPARQEVYDFIIFKASDIKDLIVCETPKPRSVDDITYDPAIVSVTKPPPHQQPMPMDERSSGHEFSQTSSPQSQQQPQQQQPAVLGGVLSPLPPPIPVNFSQPPPPLPAQLCAGGGAFGQQRVQRSYYNRAMQPLNHGQHQPPQQSYHHVPAYRPQEYHQQQVPHNRRGGGGPPPPAAHLSYQQQQHRMLNARPQHFHPRSQQLAPKFDGDFDFEKANEQFRESVGDLTENLAKARIGNKDSEEQQQQKPAQEKQPALSNRSSTRASEERSSVEKKLDDNFYDKTKSFFDNISCEALEKEAGRNNRMDWKKERLTNQETFGTSAVRLHHNFRRGSRGGGRGGGYQPRNGGGNRFGTGGGGYFHQQRTLQAQQNI